MHMHRLLLAPVLAWALSLLNSRAPVLQGDRDIMRMLCVEYYSILLLRLMKYCIHDHRCKFRVMYEHFESRKTFTCIRESVYSLCRDDTDAPIAYKYILNASKLSNAWILRLFG